MLQLEELERLKHENAQLQDQIASIQRDHAEEKQAHERRATENDQLRVEFADSLRRLEVVGQERERMKETHSRTEEENSKLRQGLEKLRKDLAAAQADNQSLRNQVKEAQDTEDWLTSKMTEVLHASGK